jgi:hypothetical protein
MAGEGKETPPKEFDSKGREIIHDESGHRITIIPEARVKRRDIGDRQLRSGTKTAHDHI